jgi:hypothetical protein
MDAGGLSVVGLTAAAVKVSWPDAYDGPVGQHVEQRRQPCDVLRGLGRHVADVGQLAARGQRALDAVVRLHPGGVCRW